MRVILLFLFVLLSGAVVYASDDENKEFLQEVIDEFREECEGEEGIDYLNCWADYTPDKCKALVYLKDKAAWRRCVYSCGSAGFFSKNFGECSK